MYVRELCSFHVVQPNKCSQGLHSLTSVGTVYERFSYTHPLNFVFISGGVARAYVHLIWKKKPDILSLSKQFLKVAE